jgi:hypothetical protein
LMLWPETAVPLGPARWVCASLVSAMCSPWLLRSGYKCAGGVGRDRGAGGAGQVGLAWVWACSPMYSYWSVVTSVAMCCSSGPRLGCSWGRPGGSSRLSLVACMLPLQCGRREGSSCPALCYRAGPRSQSPGGLAAAARLQQCALTVPPFCPPRPAPQRVAVRQGGNDPGGPPPL